MKNIEITSSVNTFTVISNDYQKAIGSPCVTLNKSDIKKIYISRDGEQLTLEICGVKDFMIGLVGYLDDPTYKSIKIDSINGIPPKTIQEIHDLFVALKNNE